MYGKSYLAYYIEYNSRFLYILHSFYHNYIRIFVYAIKNYIQYRIHIILNRSLKFLSIHYVYCANKSYSDQFHFFQLQSLHKSARNVIKFQNYTMNCKSVENSYRNIEQQEHYFSRVLRMRPSFLFNFEKPYLVSISISGYISRVHNSYRTI